MMDNLREKIVDIEKLLARWTFRNLTVYGRIIVVKALALSKITHLIQVIPNPDPILIQKLQQSINKFIWKGNSAILINRIPSATQGPIDGVHDE